ncbi:MAG: hypothetical protein AAF436_21455, partial [Myxococcota bacterium]
VRWVPALGGRWARGRARVKRSLDVVDEAPTLVRAPTTRRVQVGTTQLSLTEVGDGTAVTRLAELLLEAGADLPTDGRVPDETRALRVVVRAPIRDREASKRGATLERSADVIVGSPRPGFARWLVQRLSER